MKSMEPQRIQITAPNKIGVGYFKQGQFAYVIGMSDEGGMYWIDKEGSSRKGQIAYLVSKTKDMRGGALWMSAGAFRYTARQKS